MGIIKKIAKQLTVSAVALSALSFSSFAYGDVTEDTWYYSYITTMTEANLVGGRDDGNFYPNEYLSLAEFSAMLANSFYGETVAALQGKFVGYWWEPYLYSSLLRDGMLNTEGDEFFYHNPVIAWDDYVNQPVTRYDVAMMVMNMMNDRQVALPEEDVLLSMVEGKDVSDNYASAVAVANFYSIMTGRDGDFDGTAYLTRAEAVVVLQALCVSPEVEMELLRDYLSAPEVEVLPEILEDEEDGDMTPETEETVPETEETAPETEETAPETEETVPETEETAPETEETAPETEETAPETEETAPDTEETAPETEETVPDTEVEDVLPESTEQEPSYYWQFLQEPALNQWKAYTILGASAPNAYIENDGVYVKNLSSNVITVEDVGNPANVQLIQGMEAPQILIYHSHGTEAFNPTASTTYKASGTHRSEDPDYNVVAVGAAMAQIFANAGFTVIHDTVQHDAGDYNNSYANSKESLAQFVESTPSLVLILDVHRDGLTSTDGYPYALQSVQGENTIAQVMLFVGSEDKGTEHPYWRENLALALQLQEGLMDYGDFARPITVASYPYNQALHTGALLLEVGNYGNTLPEAIAAGELFAKSASSSLTGKSVAELFGG